MNDEDYCELYGMVKIGCAHCRNQPSIEEQAERETRDLRARLLATDPRWFPAQYPGKCGHCNTPFGPGTLIRQPTGPNYRWTAECCA